MFTSAKKAYNANSDLKTTGTLFEFLKKKKKISVDNSLQKSRQSYNKSTFDSTPLDFQDYNAETERAVTHRKNQKLEVTPKKVSFADQQTSLPKKSRNTFVQMISPMKKRCSVNAVAPQNDSDTPTKRECKPAIRRTSQKFARKNMNESIGILKSTLQSLIIEGQSIKQKAHTLAVQLRPILKYVEEGQNKNFAKRAQETKEKLRIFQYSFKEFDIEEANLKIQSFHQNLSEHILSLQAQIKSEFNKEEDTTVARMKQNYEYKIEELSQENDSLRKKIDILERKAEKLEAKNEELLEEKDENFQNYQQISAKKLSKLQETIRDLEEQNIQLKEIVEEMRKSEEQLNCKLKDTVYGKEQIEKRLLAENQKVKSAKEQFLIQEISTLKQEFQRDMKQLATLYTSKEQEQTLIITQLKREIDDLKQHQQTKRSRDALVNQQSDNLKVLATKYKRQNECLVSDMHRMNEELYQHWLALKDVKTLATRLGLMDRFVRIYADIPFNDQLFS